MSISTPPRGRVSKKPQYEPTNAIQENDTLEPTEPREHQKKFDIVILLVILALVALYVATSMGLIAPASSPILAYNHLGITFKPGKVKADTNTALLPKSNLPVVSEVMTSNKGSITAEDGNYYDWIEICNPTGHTINLAGFALSDNPQKLAKFVLPNYSLNPGKAVIVFASKLISRSTEIHANFRLKSAGQVLVMSDPNGRQIQSITLPSMQSDYSYAMDMNDPTKWTLTDKYTPGYPNSNDGWAAYQKTRHATAAIYINEIMAGNTLTIKDKDGAYSDWIELYNPTDQPVDITGWGLSNKESEPKRWVFPQMKIEPKQYIVVFASGKNLSVKGQEMHTNFRLNAFKDTVILSNIRGQIVSETLINRLKPDTSWGLVPGTDKWQVFTQPTPGYPNNEQGWNAFQHR